jgi:hypothetical protein
VLCAESQVFDYLESQVGWAEREYSKSDVDEAGHILAAPDSSEDQLDRALQVINNWRACHNFPLKYVSKYSPKKSRRISQFRSCPARQAPECN